MTTMTNNPQQVSIDTALAEAFEEILAQKWHESSLQCAADSIPMGHPQCECSAAGRRLRQLLIDIVTTPIPEPPGLGAVVSNPLTGGTWVRSTHPRLPNPEPTGQDWSAPHTNEWATFASLPLPLVVRADGWEPPPTTGGETR
ncbi:hypothetical protein [Nocardioides aromaticivorans]|uniref:hypothetical protein n=1 Tax=Nocardioides aromaticivorans TaxID=200618 RepID=UPI001A8F55A2|nr:hypothetical protein [Nocardioides aromaticivorans]